MNSWSKLFEPDQNPTLVKQGTRLGKYWTWIMATGVIYLVLGVMAFTTPVESTIGLTYGLAILLLIGGAMRLIQAYKLKSREGSALRFFQSALSLIIGLLMLRYPGGGALGLALALSFYFLLGAAVQWILAMTLPPTFGRGWGFVSALASFALGLFIVFTFPTSAVWVPGTLLGIELIFSGAAMIAVASAAKKLHQMSPTSVRDIEERFTENKASSQ